MCGSAPKVDTSAQDAQEKAAKTARIEEEQRQQRLKFGQTRIDAIFGGGTAFDTVEGFNDSQGIDSRPPLPPATGGPRAAPIEFGGLGRDGREAAFEAQRQEQARLDAEFQQNAIDTRPPPGPFASTTFAGFDPLVERRRQAGLDVALPQLDKRFGDARSELAFNLSRAGLSNSSQAASRQADLGEVFQLEDANIRAGVEGDVAALRSRIAAAKADAELQLRATSDPSAAVNTALASRARFADEQPAGFTLGDVFATALTGIGQGVNTFQANRDAERLSALLASSTTKGSGRVVK